MTKNETLTVISAIDMDRPESPWADFVRQYPYSQDIDAALATAPPARYYSTGIRGSVPLRDITDIGRQHSPTLDRASDVLVRVADCDAVYIVREDDNPDSRIWTSSGNARNVVSFYRVAPWQIVRDGVWTFVGMPIVAGDVWVVVDRSDCDGESGEQIGTVHSVSLLEDVRAGQKLLSPSNSPSVYRSIAEGHNQHEPFAPRAN
jgi:hypothetical protein